MRQKTPSVLSILLVVGFKFIVAQNINPGEIVLTTCNENGVGSFSFLTLVPLPSGTVLHLTDRGWDTTTQNFAFSNEGTITWTATEEIAPLEEIIFTNVSSGTINVSRGTAVMDGNISMEESGDQILIYQETANSNLPNFIYLFNKGASIISNAGGIKGSPLHTMQPEGLVLNTTAFHTLQNHHNWQFDCNGQNTGNKESLLLLFMDEANYNTNDDPNQPYENGALSQSGCSFVLTQEDITKPIINEQSIGLREDAGIHFEVGIPQVFDMAYDAFQDWAIVGGADQERFDIDSDTGMITVQDNSLFDFENLNAREFTLEIRVADDSGNASEIDPASGKGTVHLVLEDYESTFSISATPTTVNEGKSAILTFTNTPPSFSPITIQLSTSGTATSGLDYQTPATTITLEANQSSQAYTINILSDNNDNELEETAQFFALLPGGLTDDITAATSIAEIIIPSGQKLGFESIELAKKIKIYPNPGKKTLYIDYSHQKQKLTHGELYSLEGKLIATIPLDKIDDRQIDISGLSKGIYLLKVYTKQASAAFQITKS